MDERGGEMRALAERFFAAIEAGDIDAVQAMYAPDAVVWHNYDDAEQTVEQNLAVLRWIAANFRGFRYEGRHCQATATGFVEQHVTRGRTANGTEFSFPACIVATVAGNKVARIDKYLDSRQLAALRD
jgi:ketosteroid isomerase-like protein